MSTSTTSRAKARTADKPRIDFNFDTWVDEDATEPYSVVLGGKRYTLTDPTLMDYRDLMRLEAAQRGGMSPDEAEQALTKLVDEAEREAFFANRLPAKAMMAMMAGYATHFGLGAPGEAPALSD